MGYTEINSTRKQTNEKATTIGIMASTVFYMLMILGRNRGRAVIILLLTYILICTGTLNRTYRKPIILINNAYKYQIHSSSAQD
nr:hypothetical protein [Tanacetum cinerariifolium]